METGRQNISVPILLPVAFVALFPVGTSAQWSDDPASNTPVCTAVNNQSAPAVIGDGKGGTIMTWVDYRNNNSDIYAQRMSASGLPLWGTDGIPVCSLPGIQNAPAIAADGKGGALITWEDYRNNDIPDIYLQHIDSSGAGLWATNGIAVCTAAGQQTLPGIAADGFGGALVVWTDQRADTASDVYMQRVSGTGAALWTPDGVSVSAAADYQLSPVLVSDGKGGAIVAWADWRAANSDLFAQRLNAAGQPMWQTDGTPLCTAPYSQILPVIVADNAGGAIVTWMDRRGGTFADIYAQRIDSTGGVLWSVNGNVVTSAYNDQEYEGVCTDGAGGVIVTWQDRRNSASADVYAQRMSADGSPLWTPNGVPICTAAGEQENLFITEDHEGGAIIAWDEQRGSTGFDVYAEKINSLGTLLWMPDGVSVTVATGDQTFPRVFADSSGSVVIAWFDTRGGDGDIYAQHEYPDGMLPIRLGSFLCTDWGGGSVRIAWETLSEIGTYGFNVQRSTDDRLTWNMVPSSFRQGAGTTNEPHDYVVVDRVPVGGVAWYRLEEIDLDGSISYSDPVKFLPVTGVRPDREGTFGLLRAYPNPFNPETTIRYDVSRAGHVRLEVFDLLGRLVSLLVDEELSPGTYTAAFHARRFDTGTYFCRLTTLTGVSTQRIIFLR
jgi:hypothetical protein